MIFHSLQSMAPFWLEAGGRLEGVTVAYHTSPRDYRVGDKVVWICHALTVNSNPEDWWEHLVGAGKLIDTEKYFVVCVNMLGSPYGSSSPSNIDPETGKPYYFSFPDITVRDMVHAMIMVRKTLGIKKVDFLIGSSIGGFQALEWSIMEPEVIGHVLFMATAARVPAYLTAFNEVQRMALEADPSFREAASLEGGLEGLKCARAIALISYRSFDGYEATQTDASEDTMFAERACSYERYQGEKLSKQFNAYSYWYLSRSVDSENIGRGRGGVAAALSMIKAKTTVVSITSDTIFPPRIVKVIADGVEGACYHEIDSKFGHDGFLLEYEQIAGIIRPILDEI